MEAQMKKSKKITMPVNITAIAGMVGGLALLGIAIGMTAKDVLIFVSPTSAILVVGGTLAATFVTYSIDEVWRALVRFAGLLKPDTMVGKNDIDRFARVAGMVHSGQLVGIENEAKEAANPFVRSGLQMLADGMPVDAIVKVLEWRMHHQEEVERSEAAVFRTMGTYAPAFGMAGTLVGLVNMLRMMGDGGTSAQIGNNLALALVTTLYGLVLANALLKPIAAKIEKKTRDRQRLMGAIIEAFQSIGEGHGPSYIRNLLYAIAATHENEVGHGDVLQPMSEKDIYGP
jgi:chemotaxis protein MotA